jgi:hypothetical protein
MNNKTIKKKSIKNKQKTKGRKEHSDLGFLALP